MYGPKRNLFGYDDGLLWTPGKMYYLISYLISINALIADPCFPKLQYVFTAQNQSNFFTIKSLNNLLSLSHSSIFTQDALGIDRGDQL